MIIVAWVALLGMLTLFFSRFLQQQHNPNEKVITYSKTGYHEVVLQRNRLGHYLARGKINGKPVEFILDTGATMVSIPGRLAAGLHLQRGQIMAVNSANGTIPVYATRLDRVRLGEILQRDIRATINPSMEGDEVLLGMSFLKHLEMNQQGEQLTLRQYRQVD